MLAVLLGTAAISVPTFQDGATAGGPARPATPSGFVASVSDEVSPAAGGLVSWTSTWQLAWRPTDDAVGYTVYAVGPEGEASRPMTTTTAPRITLSAAAGTTTVDARLTQRDAQLAYRATQLGVTVVAVSPDGTESTPSDVFPVGITRPPEP